MSNAVGIYNNTLVCNSQFLGRGQAGSRMSQQSILSAARDNAKWL